VGTCISTAIVSITLFHEEAPGIFPNSAQSLINYKADMASETMYSLCSPDKPYHPIWVQKCMTVHPRKRSSILQTKKSVSLCQVSLAIIASKMQSSGYVVSNPYTYMKTFLKISWTILTITQVLHPLLETSTTVLFGFTHTWKLKQQNDDWLEVGGQWLMPIILATQEAEIKRTQVWSQHRQIVHKTLSWKNTSQKSTTKKKWLIWANTVPNETV
jgi:hypothetical protein